MSKKCMQRWGAQKKYMQQGWQNREFVYRRGKIQTFCGLWALENNLDMFESFPDHLCEKAVEKNANMHWCILLVSVRPKKMIEKAVLKDPRKLLFILNQYKTQKLYEKEVKSNLCCYDIWEMYKKLMMDIYMREHIFQMTTRLKRCGKILFQKIPFCRNVALISIKPVRCVKNLLIIIFHWHWDMFMIGLLYLKSLMSII